MKFIQDFIRRASGYDQLAAANRELSLALELATSEQRRLVEGSLKTLMHLQREMALLREEDVMGLAGLIRAKKTTKPAKTKPATAKKKER